MKNRILTILGVFCLFLMTTTICNAAAAKDFPQKTITLIVPYSPGGGFDAYSRAIARFMPKYLPKKVHIIVKNVPGACGSRGYTFLYRSKPDGYTIGMINFPGALVSQMIRKQQYDLPKFEFIGMVGRSPYILSVPKNSPFYTLEDLQKAKSVNFSTVGKGGTDYAVLCIATSILKINASLVTCYKGSTGCIVGAVRGDVDATVQNMTTLLPYINAGELRPIVAFTSERSEFLPDIPTAKELGYNGGLGQLLLYRLVAAPPETPEDITKILKEALMRTLADEEFGKWSVKTKQPLKWDSAEKSTEIVNDVSEMLEKYKDQISK